MTNNNSNTALKSALDETLTRERFLSVKLNQLRYDMRKTEAELTKIREAITALRSLISGVSKEATRTVVLFRKYLMLLGPGKELILSDMHKFFIENNWSSPSSNHQQMLMQMRSRGAREGYLEKDGNHYFYTTDKVKELK